MNRHEKRKILSRAKSFQKSLAKEKDKWQMAIDADTPNRPLADLYISFLNKTDDANLLDDFLKLKQDVETLSEKNRQRNLSTQNL